MATLTVQERESAARRQAPEADVCALLDAGLSFQDATMLIHALVVRGTWTPTALQAALLLAGPLVPSGTLDRVDDVEAVEAAAVLLDAGLPDLAVGSLVTAGAWLKDAADLAAAGLPVEVLTELAEQADARVRLRSLTLMLEGDLPPALLPHAVAALPVGHEAHRMHSLGADWVDALWAVSPYAPAVDFVPYFDATPDSPLTGVSPAVRRLAWQLARHLDLDLASCVPAAMAIAPHAWAPTFTAMLESTDNPVDVVIVTARALEQDGVPLSRSSRPQWTWPGVTLVRRPDGRKPEPPVIRAMEGDARLVAERLFAAGAPGEAAVAWAGPAEAFVPDADGLHEVYPSGVPWASTAFGWIACAAYAGAAPERVLTLAATALPDGSPAGVPAAAMLVGCGLPDALLADLIDAGPHLRTAIALAAVGLGPADAVQLAGDEFAPELLCLLAGGATLADAVRLAPTARGLAADVAPYDDAAPIRVEVLDLLAARTLTYQEVLPPHQASTLFDPDIPIEVLGLALDLIARDGSRRIEEAVTLAAAVAGYPYADAVVAASRRRQSRERRLAAQARTIAEATGLPYPPARTVTTRRPASVAPAVTR